MSTITKIITTLTLGLWPKQRAWKDEGQKCNLGVTFPLPRVQESVSEWTHTFLSELLFWELESQGTF